MHWKRGKEELIKFTYIVRNNWTWRLSSMNQEKSLYTAFKKHRVLVCRG